MPDSSILDAQIAAAACVLSRSDLRALDRLTIDGGIAPLDLMERAGIELTAAINRLTPDASRVLILAGGGNNGGDGYVIARLLHEEGSTATVAQVGKQPAEHSQCATNMDRWKAMGGVVVDAQRACQLLRATGEFDLVIDALFGTGLDRAIEGEAADVILAANNNSTTTLAVDVPSGLDCDTGRPFGPCIRAGITATIGSATPGLFLADGPEWCGQVEVVDIGLATPTDAGITPVGRILDADTVAPLLPTLPRTAHKGTRGHVLIVGGSTGKSGAAVLAARAALRAGAGLVTIGVPACIAAAVDSMMPETMTLALADDGEGNLDAGAWQAIRTANVDFDVLAVGPGLGTGDGAGVVVGEALQHFEGPIILDADALNVVAGDAPSLSARLARRRKRDHGGVILTPHPGEMARLLASNAAAVQADRASIVRAFANSHNAVLLLKGAATLVAEQQRLAFNSSGNAGMATAGMGDVLTGITASLAARILCPYDAACAAAYIHGKAGDLAALHLGSSGFLASEVADLVPAVLDWLVQTSGGRSTQT
jgi:NAD(P)H-hydrate epimerase